MRTPLALRLSPAMRAALVRRAVGAGVDPSGPNFSRWVGDLLVAGLPTVVGELLRADLSADPRSDDDPGPEPGVASEVLTTSPTASVAGPATEPGATDGAAAAS